MVYTHSWVKKKLPLALGCGRSARQAFFIVCLRRPFNTDGVEVMGQDHACVRWFVCDRSLAELRRFYSAGTASTIESRDFHGGRIQQSDPALSGKIQKKNKVL